MVAVVVVAAGSGTRLGAGLPKAFVDVAGRSLLCSHQGCEVRWRPELERYRCPCHQGMFDSGGRPFSGPPARELGVVQVRIVAGEIVVVDEPKS